jgi:hypothetical protein
MHYSVKYNKLSSSVLKSYNVNDKRLLARNLTIY